jgi:hypothetical protein
LAHPLLNHVSVEMLRTQSILSGEPVGGQLLTDDGFMNLVGIDQWVVPKYTFVTLWMWLMLQGKPYAAKVNHTELDPTLLALNQEIVKNLPKLRNATNPINLTHHIWNHINRDSWKELDIECKRDILRRVLQECDQPMG